MDYEITLIEAQKRNKNRVNIHLDGSFEFGLTRILAAGLHIGERISAEQVEKLKQKDGDEVVYLRALNFISFQPRTTYEVNAKLNKLGYSSEMIKKTIERLRENHLLEDREFAQNWAENRAEFKPRGRKLIRLELRKKGIMPEVIDASIQSIPPEEELAFKAANVYARRLESLDWEHFHDRLTGFLLRRGFDYSATKSAVLNVWNTLKQNREGN